MSTRVSGTGGTGGTGDSGVTLYVLGVTLNFSFALGFLVLTPHPASALPNGCLGLVFAVAALVRWMRRHGITVRVRA